MSFVFFQEFYSCVAHIYVYRHMQSPEGSWVSFLESGSLNLTEPEAPLSSWLVVLTLLESIHPRASVPQSQHPHLHPVLVLETQP